MPEREWVIKELECIRDYDPMIRTTHDDVFKGYAEDALALLKEQEPIEPIHTDKYMRTEPITFEYKCAVCEVGLMRHWVCCPCCGQAVKWE